MNAPRPPSVRTSQASSRYRAPCPTRGYVIAALAVLAFVATLFAGASQAIAQPRQPDPLSQRRLEADGRFRRGVELTKAKLYSEALIEFLAAYDAVPHYAVLYNIGMLYASLGEASKAAAAFDEYLRQGGSALSAERCQEVARLLEEQRNRLGTVSFEIDPEGARVFLDGEDVGRAPLSLFPITAGFHNLVVSKSGYEVAQQRISVRSGEPTVIRVALTPAAATNETGQLRPTSSVPTFNLWLDGRLHGPVQGEEVLELSVGSHAFEFEGSGYLTQRGFVSITAGRVTSLACAPAVSALGTGASATGPTPPSSPDSRTGPKEQRLWMYVTAGAGAVLAAGAVTAWLVGERTFGEFRTEQARLKTRLDELPQDNKWFEDENRSHDTLDTAYAWRLAAAGLGVGSAFALTATGILWFSGGSSAWSAGDTAASSKSATATWSGVW